MKVIPRLDVSCLYKQTGQASAIFPVFQRREKSGEENGESVTATEKKKNDKKETICILWLGPGLRPGPSN